MRNIVLRNIKEGKDKRYIGERVLNIWGRGKDEVESGRKLRVSGFS